MMGKHMTYHRIEVWWEDATGYWWWMSSDHSGFNDVLQEMVAEYGPPARVEFVAHNGFEEEEKSNGKVERASKETTLVGSFTRDD
jgi:hypothetical protein